MSELQVEMVPLEAGHSVSVDLPRRLTEIEAHRIADGIQDVWDQLEWERTVPAHVCDQEHGQLGYRHPAICLQGCKLNGLEGSTEEQASANAGRAVKAHQATGHEVMVSATVDGPMFITAPTCHDCGRALVRPSGTRDDCWVCPLVSAHPLAQTLPAGTALECQAPK